MATTDQFPGISPITYWQFEETKGTTASDSATGLDGIYKNGVNLGTEGVRGNAAKFDGENDYMLVEHNEAFALDEGTVQLWFNADELEGRQGLFSKDAWGFGTGGHLSVYLQGDDLVARLQDTDESHRMTVYDELSTDSWHQVAVSWGKAGLNLYMDGVLRKSIDYTGGLDATSGGSGNTEPITIGASLIDSLSNSSEGVGHFFNGQIDDVAVFGSQLGAADIATLYKTGIDVPSTGTSNRSTTTSSGSSSESGSSTATSSSTANSSTSGSTSSKASTSSSSSSSKTTTNDSKSTSSSSTTSTTDSKTSTADSKTTTSSSKSSSSSTKDTTISSTGNDTTSDSGASKSTKVSASKSVSSDPVKIMPLGDSITEGSSSGGYRPKLWNKLKADGLSVDFVGSQERGPSGFDDDHEAYRGKTIDWIDARVVGFLKSNPADVVLLMIGTNDTGTKDTASEMGAQLTSTINKIISVDSDIKILLASIPPVDPDRNTAARVAKTEAYNALIPKIAAKYKAVEYVDMSKITPDDLADSVHPNSTGYEKIASAYEDAILDIWT